ncbi:MAG TPA: polysaccharide deacetylase family protein [Devosia sp.]|jgi:peptidoglycan/xylan/chitin deacetylase (PgdA/CDA1 family)|nr:polysaccharide deacetylase family protein [Devosia sp.]
MVSQAQHTDTALITNSILPASQPIGQQPMPERIFSGSNLAGRTLVVGSTADLILRPGEVVLTFDDGPRPGKTDSILAALDDFGVKATFLMLGSSAQAHPRLAQQVAARGHTVGSHTFDHVDLSTLSRQSALDEVAKGERAVRLALAGGGQALSPFFRFPYLSQTGFLRTSLMQGSMVVLDVDIDSKDYYKETAATVAARTLQRLENRGSGIILFHDIHQRTVDMMPVFLAALQERGYSVVRLVPQDNSIFGRDLITADAPPLRGSL